MFKEEINKKSEENNENPEIPDLTNDGDKIWDKLFASPESEAFLTMLVSEAKRNEEEGKFDKDEW